MAAARRADAAAPIDHVLSVAEVQAWMKTAQCGDRLRYAQGRQLVRGETARLMRTLQDSGEVKLFQPRSASGDGFDYLAIRNRVKVETQRPAPRVQAGPVLDETTSAIFLMLKTAARLRYRCPSDGDMAKQFGKSRNQVGWSIRKLVDLKLIEKRIEPTPVDSKFRVVRIIQSGHETAGPKS